MRVYEAAKKFNTTHQSIIAVLNEHGVEVDNHKSTLDTKAIGVVERHFGTDDAGSAKAPATSGNGAATAAKSGGVVQLNRVRKKKEEAPPKPAEKAEAPADSSKAQRRVVVKVKKVRPVAKAAEKPPETTETPAPAAEAKPAPAPDVAPVESAPVAKTPAQAETKPAAKQESEAAAQTDQPVQAETKEETVAEAAPQEQPAAKVETPETAEAAATDEKVEPAAKKSQQLRGHKVRTKAHIDLDKFNTGAQPTRISKQKVRERQGGQPDQKPRQVASGGKHVISARNVPGREQIQDGFERRGPFVVPTKEKRAEMRAEKRGPTGGRGKIVIDRNKTRGGRGGRPGAGGTIGSFAQSRLGGPSVPPPVTPDRGGGGGDGRRAGDRRRDSGRGRRLDRQERMERRQERDFELKKQQKAREAAVPPSIDVVPPISVGDLAKKMNLRGSDVILKLMQLGMQVRIMDVLDQETVEIVTAEFNCVPNFVDIWEQTEIDVAEVEDGALEARPPVITVMGHVDHGKTKLLDAIRSSDVVSREAGGITQHIGAYHVKTPQGSFTFLDTPGHEAFTQMRKRGASVTDIVILVVAADDGFMTQTDEALSHAKAAEVPIIVAINKIDSEGANPDKVKSQLSERELMPEEWGGETQVIEVSALKNQNIDKLLEAIELVAELEDLKAAPDINAHGIVIESRLDPGHGPVATVLVQTGTLRVGDTVVAGRFMGRVRAMFDSHGKRLKTAGPGIPVEISGLDDVPEASDPFNVVDEKQARNVIQARQDKHRMHELAESSKRNRPTSLDDLYSQIREGEIDELKMIIRADVQGSVEAMHAAFDKLSNDRVRVNVILRGTGAITESDVNLAAASNALIIGFNVKPNSRAAELAETEKVDVELFTVIYDAIGSVRNAMEGLLPPEFHEVPRGQAEVRQVFKISRIGVVAGCYVKEGYVGRNHKVRVFREGEMVFQGNLASLKRFKDDAAEVKQGFECGMTIENFNDLREGDVFESYEVREVAAKLD